jgi:hypothetical protein
MPSVRKFVTCILTRVTSIESIHERAREKDFAKEGRKRERGKEGKREKEKKRKRKREGGPEE